MKAVLVAVAVSGLMAGSAMAVDNVTLHLAAEARAKAQERVACAKLSQQTVAWDGVPLIKRLDDVPQAVLAHAVLRTIAGCGVSEVVYRGRTFYVLDHVRDQPESNSRDGFAPVTR